MSPKGSDFQVFLTNSKIWYHWASLPTHLWNQLVSSTDTELGIDAMNPLTPDSLYSVLLPTWILVSIRDFARDLTSLQLTFSAFHSVVAYIRVSLNHFRGLSSLYAFPHAVPSAPSSSALMGSCAQGSPLSCKSVSPLPCPSNLRALCYFLPL